MGTRLASDERGRGAHRSKWWSCPCGWGMSPYPCVCMCVHMCVCDVCVYVCAGAGDDGSASGERTSGTALGIYGGRGQRVGVLPPGPLYSGDRRSQPHTGGVCLEVGGVEMRTSLFHARSVVMLFSCTYVRNVVDVKPGWQYIVSVALQPEVIHFSTDLTLMLQK